MHTNTHFPTGVVHGSERLPVITTAIDQSDQRKLKVDWPGCFTEEWGCFSDSLTLPPISFFSHVLLLLLCYSPLFISPFLSAFFSLLLKVWDLLPCATPPSTLHPCFLFLGSSFVLCPCEATVLSLWGRCISSYCPRTHKHIHTHTKAPGEVISLGLQLSEQQASVGGGYGGYRTTHLLLGRYGCVRECVCVQCGNNAPIICVMGSLFSVSTLCVCVCTLASSLCILNFCLPTLSIKWISHCEWCTITMLQCYVVQELIRVMSFHCLYYMSSKCYWVTVCNEASLRDCSFRYLWPCLFDPFLVSLVRLAELTW